MIHSDYTEYSISYITLLIFIFQVAEYMFMYMSTTSEIMVLVTLVAIDIFRKICGILWSKEIAFFLFLIYTTLYVYTEISVYIHIY